VDNAFEYDGKQDYVHVCFTLLSFALGPVIRF
jgi:hypothetical protein